MNKNWFIKKLFRMFLCHSLILTQVKAEPVLTTLHGLWIDEGYKYTLNSSFSPCSAANTSIIPAFSIDTTSKMISISYNFHETAYLKMISFDKQNGKIVIENSDHEIFIQNESIFLSHKDYNGIIRKRQFVKLSSDTYNTYEGILTYAKSEVINGEYSDAKGNKFRFDNNKAIWPGKQFNWSIILDCVEYNPIDILCEIDSSQNCLRTYGFVSNGKILQIYEYDDNKKIIGQLLYDLIKSKTPGK